VFEPLPGSSLAKPRPPNRSPNGPRSGARIRPSIMVSVPALWDTRYSDSVWLHPRAKWSHMGRADQLKLWTDYRLNDRLNCAEGRTQCTLEVVPLGQKPR
jgi:hypothetical protein